MRNLLHSPKYFKYSLLAGACATLLTGCFVFDWKAAYVALGKSYTTSEQVLVDADQLYIAGQSDVYHAYIAAYDTAGKLLWDYDAYDGVSAFSTIQGGDSMAVGPDGRLYYLINLITTPAQSKVFVFSRQGQLLDSWLTPVGHEARLRVAKDGALHIYANYTGHLATYTPSGALQWQYQAPPPTSGFVTVTAVRLLEDGILVSANEHIHLLSLTGEMLRAETIENFALTDLYNIAVVDNVVWMVGKGATGVELVSLDSELNELTRATLKSGAATSVQIAARQGGFCMGISHVNQRDDRFFSIVQTNEQGTADWLRDIVISEDSFRFDDLVRSSGAECYVATGWSDEKEIPVSQIRRFLVDGKPADTITQKKYMTTDYSVIGGAVYQTGRFHSSTGSYYPVTYKYHLQ